MSRMISILVPAFNEAENIRELFSSIPVFNGFETELIIVDDGSTDETYSVAEELSQKKHSTKALRYRRNHGKGFALRYGFSVARGHIIAVNDADMPPQNLLILIDALETGKSEIVYSSRLVDKMENDAMPISKYFGNIVIARCLNLLTGYRLTDYLSGQKVFTRRAFEKVLHQTDGWPDIEWSFKARKHGLTINEVPIFYERRKAGISKMKLLTGLFFLWEGTRYFVKRMFGR